MKVSGTGGTGGTGGIGSTSGPRGPSRPGGGESFRVAAPPTVQTTAQVSQAAGMNAVMGVEALLSLQDVGSPGERKRRAVGRAGRILDVLDEI